MVSKPRSFLAPTCGRYSSSDVVATRSWTPEVAAQLPEWLGICRVQQNFPPRAIRESFETPVLNNIQETILGQDADSVRNNLLVARDDRSFLLPWSSGGHDKSKNPVNNHKGRDGSMKRLSIVSIALVAGRFGGWVVRGRERTFAGAAAASGTYRRPQLLVDGKQFRQHTNPGR
jgi:hypothetical protein